MKYLKGDLYVNGLVSQFSEAVADVVGILIFNRFGLSKTLMAVFLIASLGMLCFIIFPTQNQVALSFFILGAKFGCSAAFNLVYIANQMLFPISIVATSYGICQIFAKFVSIFSGYVAEIKPEKVPEWIYVIVCAVAFFASIFLRKPKE